MKIKGLLFLIAISFLASCSSDDNYVDLPEDPISPVFLDLELVPYQKLSEYVFFEGDMKNQMPVYGVLPYEPISSLFTDYAKKNVSFGCLQIQRLPITETVLFLIFRLVQF